MTPMDDSQKASLDQQAAMIGDMLPPLWRRIYLGCIEQGFSDVDSLRLVIAYIAQSGGIKL